MQNTYCVIMAGGIGSRFWPMSRTKHPKQFHDILGTGETLIQQTFNRFLDVCPKENFLIVTNAIYKKQVLEQLPGIVENQVLCEPTMRNTAPCIAYANHKIASMNPNANIIVAPSDHLVTKQREFTEVINLGLKQTTTHNCLVTLGIKPTRPDTGYGYIQFEEQTDDTDSHIRKVNTFTEKPELPVAKQFLESGDFYWNSGIFIWSLKAIQREFEHLLPQMNNIFKQGEGLYNTDAEQQFINKVFPTCENVSIDYGIMEKAKEVFVVLADVGWSDLGTWGSLYTHVDHDDKANAVIGKKVKLYDSEKNIVNVPKEKLVVLQGLDNYIVVDTNDVLLICKKEDEQQIKQFVADLKSSSSQEYV